VESVEKSKSKNDFSTVPTALGNPAKDAGFPHFHRAGGEFYSHGRREEKMTWKPNSS